MTQPRQFVIEADGGSRGNPGPAGYGAVVIDPVTGETLAEAAEYIGVATNNVAEYKGLIAGLKAAKALVPDASAEGALQVRVRMDSKLVVEQMSGRWKIKHPDMKPLAAAAARILPASAVTYEWIPREKNKHADRLANEAMDAGKRGKQWEPSASTAALDLPPVSGPPGDAAAGAAKARAAMSTSRETAAAPQVGWGAADLGAPATFVLLRHGETALTPEKRFSGSGGSDPELSAAGRHQAERVAESLAARGTIQEIISSPLRRCRETAATVGARLGLPVQIEDGLRETDFGAWEGLTFAEVRERYGPDLDAWLASTRTPPTGGGESFAEVARRVSATRDRLTTRHAGRTVLLVTHVTPIKTLARLALGAPPESLFRMELSAASLSAVAYYADGNASLRLLNDTSHLR
ncbi:MULTISPECIES: bifunctional RNase H/acid phosphatase [unclassified Streptomyces]|uniref:bifunctional RNase H/acid phosphatase n=1 Tax=unclassified Streptomyces TaxID=2593676 RepID=UPI002DD8D0C9|nr:MULTISPECIES: bifunctional RNase H/acid phosphatase [unclassified Streptomyces]WSF87052.1 bifunctional RNase H/acid phosphatase [Streptomyces sp. NBC_01744]WSC36706.1 bifunctional RNase H/acid phosphatase [Streptomyces sp. NBC_01763]WSC44803.1 bifunctional RNase H/acid phosphatase [Streptomyces sp. NBC_01762]WSC56215.1 bifunctional RNase H/acid phosphatase [Streptomyces sp. NBC_01761]WSD24390.1 bifunctional RNase H/acid phosphatase [Streptomyces sp. NBC_01751]